MSPSEMTTLSPETGSKKDSEAPECSIISPGTAPKSSKSPLKQRKRRRAVTDVERKALRDYFHDESNGKPPQKKLQQWFHKKFNHQLAQSSISDILGPTYVHLDNTKALLRPDNKKTRASHWPDLEEALFDWQQKMQNKGAVITGDILKEMAAEFWIRLPQYNHLPIPKFSNGWLQAFKKRHQIKRYTRHGEAGAVDRVFEKELIELREDILPYSDRDIYNMDETALIWEMTPDDTLA